MYVLCLPIAQSDLLPLATTTKYFEASFQSSLSLFLSFFLLKKSTTASPDLLLQLDQFVPSSITDLIGGVKLWSPRGVTYCLLEEGGGRRREEEEEEENFFFFPTKMAPKATSAVDCPRAEAPWEKRRRQ